MKYIKFTYLPGPVYPAVAGLQFVWARESDYPTDTPEFFGTCPDNSNTDSPGVLGVFLQSDWDQMRIDEMTARTAKANSGRRITKLAFDNRFTTGEKVMLEIAALDNPAATMPQRQQAAALRINQRQIDRAEFIDLTRPETRAGVQQLEAGGLLAAGRALIILDAPVTEIERYKG